ncbi:MAG: flagellar hook-length control protein FliK [Myxococcales bacterium]|nr:flagellar hook-length control protein FliK [Myxococcales bacterium]
MGRIEDDREAQRVALKLMLQKREQEQKAKERSQADSAFARLVGKQQAEKQQVQKDSSARSAIAHLLEKEGHEEALEAAHDETARTAEREHLRGGESRSRSRTGLGAFEGKLKEARASEGERAFAGRASDQSQAAVASEGRAADRGGAEAGAAGRKADAKSQRESLEERKEGSQQAAASKGGARFGKGELKADADRGGGGGQKGGQKDNKPSSELAAGFRFNPALMAPVPVAKSRDLAGSERLRALAAEIAQKIVERVRVGTNAAGKTEFQIDLRSDVLAGLSIKVSGSGGRIKAVFSGRDREVLKLLADQSESLRSALTGRGLTLEDLRIEEQG